MLTDVTNWLCRRPEELTEDERLKLKAILDRYPELQAASGQVRAFAAMITNLTGQNLPQWIAAARDAGLPGIASFAKGLEHDIGAVTNGLTMSWSSGPVEGRVNLNIKMVKRQMVGRAGLPLLRKRVRATLPPLKVATAVANACSPDSAHEWIAAWLTVRLMAFEHAEPAATAPVLASAKPVPGLAGRST